MENAHAIIKKVTIYCSTLSENSKILNNENLVSQLILGLSILKSACTGKIITEQPCYFSFNMLSRKMVRLLSTKLHCRWQKFVIEKVVNQPLKLRDPRPIP